MFECGLRRIPVLIKDQGLNKYYKYSHCVTPSSEEPNDLTCPLVTNSIIPHIYFSSRALDTKHIIPDPSPECTKLSMICIFNLNVINPL